MKILHIAARVSTVLTPPERILQLTAIVKSNLAQKYRAEFSLGPDFVKHDLLMFFASTFSQLFSTFSQLFFLQVFLNLLSTFSQYSFNLFPNFVQLFHKRTCISSYFGHQVALLELVANVATSRYYLY